MNAPRLIVSNIVEIERPAEAVWAVLTDFGRYGEWNPLCLAIEVDPLVGGAVRMQIEDPRSETPVWLDYVVAAFDPPALLAWQQNFSQLALTARRDQFVQALDKTRSAYFSTDLYWGDGADAAYAENAAWVRRGFTAMARALADRVTVVA